MAILPKIVYNFNENDATTIRDYSENGNDGSSSSITISASTRVGNDAVFNAINDNILLGAFAGLDGKAECSIHLGISITTGGSGNRDILGKLGTISIKFDYSTNTISCDLFVNTGTATVSGIISRGVFYDIDIVYESDVLVMYINGVSFSSDTTKSGVIQTLLATMYIGHPVNNGCFMLLNEFKLYDTAITTEIITATINQQNGIYTDTLEDSNFEVGDVIFTNLDTTPLYAVISWVGTGTDYRFLPLTSGIFGDLNFRRGAHLWDTTRQFGLKIDDTPQVCFYDNQTKSTEIFTDDKKTYCIGVNGVSSSNLKIIDSKEGLPAPSAGVITLETPNTYFLTENIDLTGDRIDTDGVVSIMGSSPEVCGLLSTGLSSGTALITSEHTISIRNIEINHQTALDLDATTNANQVLDWFGVNFTDATTSIGVIKNYDNTIFNTIGFLNSGGLTFDGTIGTIAFTDTFFQNATGLTSLILPSSLTISRRFRIDNSAFVTLSGETSLNASLSATIPNEGYVLENVNFSGDGTFLAGVQSTDNKARFNGCRGIDNSGNISQYYMQGNNTLTTISSSGVFVKIAGATTTGLYVEKFDVTTTDNKSIYEGSLTGFYKVEVIASCTSGNNKELEIAIYKNGVISAPSRSKGTTTGSGKAENIVSQDIVQLSTDDFIEVYIAQNTGATNITVEDLNVTIVRLN